MLKQFDELVIGDELSSKTFTEDELGRLSAINPPYCVRNKMKNPNRFLISVIRIWDTPGRQVFRSYLDSLLGRFLTDESIRPYFST